MVNFDRCPLSWSVANLIHPNFTSRSEYILLDLIAFAFYKFNPIIIHSIEINRIYSFVQLHWHCQLLFVRFKKSDFFRRKLLQQKKINMVSSRNLQLHQTTLVSFNWGKNAPNMKLIFMRNSFPMHSFPWNSLMQQVPLLAERMSTQICP